MDRPAAMHIQPQPEPEKHAIPIIADMGKVWLGIGVVLFLIGLVGGIIRIFWPPFMEKPEADVPIQLVPGPLSLIAISVAVLGGANACLWVLFDLLDRKGRLSWIVPMLIFSMCGAYALPLGIYLYLRKDLRPT